MEPRTKEEKELALGIVYGKPIPVLDHGYVTLIESMGTEATIIEAARMSTSRGFISWDPYHRCKDCNGLRSPASSEGFLSAPDVRCEHRNVEKFPRGDFGLLEYLYMNAHTTPFEMCELHVEVNAPIFVWRQWHRHRTQSYNEQSGRYGELPDLFYVPDAQRLVDSFQIGANKQAAGSGRMVTTYEADEIRTALAGEQTSDRKNYERRLSEGMAPELARVNIPVSQYSKCRVKTDLHNWLGFLRLRMDEHAQWEIREYARAVGKIIQSLWPRVYGLFVEETLNAVKFNETEIHWLRRFASGFSGTIAAATKADPRINSLALGTLERKRLLRKLMIEED